MGVERRGRVICGCIRSINRNPLGFGRSRVNELKSPDKPFEISKWAVQEAWEKVKANKGAPGVDGVSIEGFEADLHNNLYKVWNRMSSGSYFPPPVRAVEIPKPHGGGTRMLGVPTIADRVAQTVVAEELAKRVEVIFHDDSYGYRPGRSALDAVGVCRQRCWKTDWVIDLDIQKFFDSVSWDLMLKAVQANTDLPWVVLYVRRWLQAPVQLPDGTLQQRDRGTPQGSPVSPVLANLFLHYAFDVWMAREFPSIRFERYVDDAVVHCVSERQARQVLAALQDRMAEVGLQLHPDKTRIVYCQDGKRRARFRAHVVYVPGLHVPAARCAGQEREHVRLVRARDQQGRLEEDRAGGAVLAPAPPNPAILLRTRTVGQSHCAGLDAVLRCVLPLGAVSAPDAHQRLPDALGPQEISPVPGTPRVPAGVAAGHYPVPAVLRPLGLDNRRPGRLVIKVTRAV